MKDMTANERKDRSCGAAERFCDWIRAGLQRTDREGHTLYDRSGHKRVSIAILIGFMTTPILWIWAIWDAKRAAEMLNAG